MVLHTSLKTFKEIWSGMLAMDDLLLLFPDLCRVVPSNYEALALPHARTSFSVLNIICRLLWVI